MRITDQSIVKITVPDGKSEIVVFDDEIAGFGVRVRKGGSRRFLFQYKMGGLHRKMTFQESSAAAARTTAAKLKAKVTLGFDVAAQKHNAKEAAADTFEFCVNKYIKWVESSTRRPKTIDAIKRHLKKNLACLNHLHIKSITRRDIADELAKLRERAPIQSNRTRASLTRFFNWAIAEGFVESNPALQTNKVEEISRDRVLSDHELSAVWNALSEGDYRDIIQLLILTGQRLREISNLRWSEIDFRQAQINLPGSRSKNRLAHTIPLSAPAIAILKAKQKSRDQDDNRAFVFGVGKVGFSAFSKSKERLDDKLSIDEPWIVHDIRRSVSTGMANLAVLPHVIEAVLNHISGGARGSEVARIYNRNSYDKEKREALDLWAKHVLKIASVKPKRRAAS